jgi:hypothetical protein
VTEASEVTGTGKITEEIEKDSPTSADRQRTLELGLDSGAPVALAQVDPDQRRGAPRTAPVVAADAVRVAWR